MDARLIDEPLLEQVYEGPLESPPWQGLVALVRQRFDVVACNLYLRLPEPGQPGLDVTDCEWDVQALRRHYASGYYRDNPFNYETMEAGRVYRWTDFISRERFVASDYYREFCQPVGFDYALCQGIEEPGGPRIFLSVVRNTVQGDFSEAEAVEFQRLYPHMRRALRLLARIQRSESERELYQSTLEQMAIGTLVLNQEGGVISINQAAREILAACPETGIREGRLRLRDPRQRSELEALVARLAGREAPATEVMALERAGGPALGILLRNLPPAAVQLDSRNRPALILYITDPGRQQLAPRELVAQLFGLTRAEATLATLLANDMSLAEAAAAMHVSEGSARSYCKRIYAKTGLGRQAEVVALVLKSVANLAG